jgi:PAS domain S-box-containing protein
MPSHTVGVVALEAAMGANADVTPFSDTSPGGATQRSDEATNRLLEQIAEALQANLTRGYLEGEERIRGIAEALHDVVALIDSTGSKVLFVNAAYERIWCRSREELYAHPLALLDGVHPQDRDRVRRTLIEQARGNYDLEYRVVRPGGDQRWVRTRAFPVRDADGNIHRIACITEDITDRKQVIESHERLIRGFTHDVKNPLGAADGYLALLELGIGGEMSAAQTESVGRARRSIRTALNLISGLLDIERAEAGQLEISEARIDLSAATVEIVGDFLASAESKNLSLTAQISPEDDPLVVESDAARVRQILANLISNAVKYTQPNGTIVVDAHLVRTDDAPWRGHWAAVSVADNGSGIPLEKQALVFREFTRFDPDAAAGSGIGLAISRRLARALGGEITFTSAPGIGSTFTLWLPVDAPAPATERRRMPRTPAGA